MTDDDGGDGDETAPGPGHAPGPPPAVLKWLARLLLYPGAVGVAWLAMRWAEQGAGISGAQDWALFLVALGLLVGGSLVGRRYYLATGQRLWF